MTVHFYTFSDRVAPSSRQRAFYVAEELEKRGTRVIVHTPTVLSISRTPWPKKLTLILQVILSLFSIKKNDIVFLQRAVYNKYFFAVMVVYLFFFRRKMIFDFDDPIYVHSYFKTKIFSQMADAVIVSTHDQLKWARQFNKNTHYIHFAITPAPYEEMSKDYSIIPERPVIGWLGTGPEHLKNLPILTPVFSRLAADGVTFTFVLIGSFNNPKVHALFEHIPGLDVRFVDRIPYTDPYSAPKEIRKFDVGVVPHQSKGPWYEGKTSMKVLEYMATAVPVVVSNFGEMPYIISDGKNGFFAATEDEWIEKLKLLLGNQKLREQIGKAGQKRVREGGFDIDSAVSKVKQVINSLI